LRIGNIYQNVGGGTEKSFGGRVKRCICEVPTLRGEKMGGEGGGSVKGATQLIV